ncbi:MAG: hypothetical protein ACKOAQ_05575, partial [Acidimicrobiaceae bacterium]
MLFDLARYFAFRLKFRNSFVPRSWLFVATTSCWALLTPTRSEALDQSPSITISDEAASEKTNSINQINSLLTCSVVVAGLLLEIGRIRGRHLAKLEAHSQLNHPSATATLTELSLRAVQSSQTFDEGQLQEVLLPSNSNAPVYVPLGISNSQQVYVDLGQGSVVSITSSDQAEQSAVFNALIVSALFASRNRLQVIFYTKNSHQKVDFAGISVASSFAEVLRLAKSTNTNYVVFSREEVSDYEISQLRDSDVALVCQKALVCSTTTLHAVDSNWHLSSSNLSITPYGLSVEQVLALSELFNEVVRCVDDATVNRETVSDSTVRISVRLSLRAA